MAERYYAVTRAMNPGTGDVLVAASVWTRGSPMAEVVARVVRTPLGSYAPDPTFGLDYDAVEKTSPSQRGAAIRDAVIAALRRWIEARLITEVAVTSEARGGRLEFEVVFRDPRVQSREPSRVRGRV